jgi:hypothetical protein
MIKRALVEQSGPKRSRLGNCEVSGVSLETIKRIERSEGLASSLAATVEMIIRAFEAAGVATSTSAQ